MSLSGISGPAQKAIDGDGGGAEICTISDRLLPLCSLPPPIQPDQRQPHSRLWSGESVMSHEIRRPPPSRSSECILGHPENGSHAPIPQLHSLPGEFLNHRQEGSVNSAYNQRGAKAKKDCIKLPSQLKRT